MMLQWILFYLIALLLATLKNTFIQCQCPTGMYQFGFSFSYEEFNGRKPNLYSSTHNIYGMRTYCGNQYMDMTTFQVVKLTDIPSTRSNKKWAPMKSSNIAQGQYFTHRTTLYRQDNSMSKRRTGEVIFYHLNRIGIYTNTMAYYDRFTSLNQGCLRSTKCIFYPSLKISNSPSWWERLTLLYTVSHRYYDLKNQNKMTILKMTGLGNSLMGNYKQVQYEYQNTDSKKDSRLYQHCNVNSTAYKKWVSSTNVMGCYRCNPNSNCLTCKDTNPDECVTCHDTWEYSPDTKICQNVLGVNEKNGRFLYAGDGHIPFDYPYPSATLDSLVPEFPIEDEQSFIISNATQNSAGKYSQRCGNMRILGGPNIFGETTFLVHNMINMAGHYKVQIEFTFYKYGLWRNNSVIITIDGKEWPVVELTGLSTEGEQENTVECPNLQTAEMKLGAGTLELRPLLVVPHNKNKLTLNITTDIKDLGEPKASWAIREVLIRQFQCDVTCKLCTDFKNTSCTSCFENFVLDAKAKTCSCKDRHYYNEIKPCLVSQCSECIPCPPQCVSCTGPAADQCKGCSDTELQYIQEDGTITCVKECPPIGTYQEGRTCKSCGKVCDNSILITQQKIDPLIQLHRGVFMNQDTSFNLYQLFSRSIGQQVLSSLQFQSAKGRWELSQQMVFKDLSKNFQPYLTNVIGYVMNMKSKIMLGYSNGMYRYGLTSSSIVSDGIFDSKPCNNQVLLNATAGTSLCTEYAGLTIYEVDNNMKNVDSNNTIYWECSIGFRIYSLYTDGKKDTAGKQLIWAGSQNVLWLITKPDCLVQQFFQFSPVNTESEVRFILPVELYNNYVIVAAAFDFATATIQLNTYQITGKTTTDANSVTFVAGQLLQMDNIKKEEVYRFNVAVIPRSTVVIVTTDVLVLQLDYLTYKEYSKFSTLSAPISMVTQVNPNRTMFYRYHQNTTYSESYLWQPYPCLNFNMDNGQIDPEIPIRCYVCDQSNQFTLDDNGCVTKKCLPTYVMDKLIQRCYNYYDIGAETLLTTSTNLTHYVQGIYISADSTNNYILLATINNDFRYIKVNLQQKQIYTLQNTTIGVSASLFPKYIDIYNQLISYTNNNGEQVVVHTAPRVSGGLVSFIFAGNIKLDNINTRSLYCTSISPFVNSIFCANKKYLQNYEYGQTNYIWQCYESSTIFVVHSQVKSNDQNYYYIWIGLLGEVKIVKKKKVQIGNVSSQCLLAKQMVLPHPQAYPLSIFQVNPYTDNSVVIVVSYQQKLMELYVETYVSKDGLIHTFNYNYHGRIQLNFTTTFTDPTVIRVNTIPSTNEFILIVPDSVYIINPIDIKITKVYFTDTFLNQAIIRLSNMKQYLLWLQQSGPNIIPRVYFSTSICGQFNPLDYPLACQQCTQDYAFVQTTCAPKFCLTNFIKDDLECFSPRKTTIMKAEWYKYPSQFNVSFNFQNLVNLTNFFGPKYDINNHTFLNSEEGSILKVQEKRFVKTIHFNPQDNFFIVNMTLTNGDLFKVTDTLHFKLNAENSASGQIGESNFLENNFITLQYQKEYAYCLPDLYYNTQAKECQQRYKIHPIVQFYQNPCILTVTLPNDSTNIFQYLLSDVNQFTISISNLIYPTDYTYVMEHDQNRKENIIYFSILYRKDLQVGVDNKLEMRINLFNKTQNREQLVVEPVYSLGGLTTFQEPVDSTTQYYDLATNTIKYKQQLLTLVYNTIDGDIFYLVNRHSQFFLKHYEKILQIKAQRNVVRLLQQKSSGSWLNIVGQHTKWLGGRDSPRLLKAQKRQLATNQLLYDFQNYTNFTSTVTKITDTSFKINIQYQEQIFDYLKVSIEISPYVYQEVNNYEQYQKSKVVMKLKRKQPETREQQMFSDLTLVIFNILNPLFVYSNFIAMVIQGGSVLQLQIAFIYKIFYKFRYIDLILPINVRNLYKSTQSNINSNNKWSLADFRDQQKMPIKCNQYAVSAYFLDNFLYYMLEMGGLLVMGLIMKAIRRFLLEYIRKWAQSADDTPKSKLNLVKKRQVVILFGYIYQAFTWNFFIAFMIVYYLDGMFFCFLTFFYTPTYSYTASLNVAVASLFFIFLFLQIPRLIVTIQLQTLIIQEEKKDQKDQYLQQLDDYEQEQLEQIKKLKGNPQEVMAEVQALKDQFAYEQEYKIQNIHLSNNKEELINLIFGKQAKYLFIEFFEKNYVEKYYEYLAQQRLEAIQRKIKAKQQQEEEKANKLKIKQLKKEQQLRRQEKQQKKLALKKQQKELNKQDQELQSPESKQLNESSPQKTTGMNNNNISIMSTQNQNKGLLRTNTMNSNNNMTVSKLDLTQQSYNQDPPVQFDSIGNPLHPEDSQHSNSIISSDSEESVILPTDFFISYKCISYHFQRVLQYLMKKLLEPNKYNRKEFYLGYKIVNYAFKQNYLLTRFFLVLDLVRVTFIGFLLAALQHYPYMLAGSLLCTIISNFLVILFTMPYKDLKCNFIMLLNELLLIISSFCFYITAFYDAHEYFINFVFRDQLGAVICISFLIFLAFNSLIAVAQIFNSINQIYLGIKQFIININAVDQDKLKILAKEIIQEKKQFQQQIKDMKMHKSYLEREDRAFLMNLKQELSTLVKKTDNESQKRILEIRQVLDDFKSKISQKKQEQLDLIKGNQYTMHTNAESEVISKVKKKPRTRKNVINNLTNIQQEDNISNNSIMETFEDQIKQECENISNSDKSSRNNSARKIKVPTENDQLASLKVSSKSKKSHAKKQNNKQKNDEINKVENDDIQISMKESQESKELTKEYVKNQQKKSLSQSKNSSKQIVDIRQIYKVEDYPSERSGKSSKRSGRSMSSRKTEDKKQETKEFAKRQE